MSAPFDQYLITLLQQEGKHAAVKYCMDTKRWDLRAAKKYVDELDTKKKDNQPEESHSLDNLNYIPKNALKIYLFLFIGICSFPFVINIPGCIKRNRIEKETMQLLEMAISSIGNGDTATSIICYQKIIEINPDYVPAYKDLADIYRNKGDTIQVQKLEEKIIILEEPYDPGI